MSESHNQPHNKSYQQNFSYGSSGIKRPKQIYLLVLKVLKIIKSSIN